MILYTPRLFRSGDRAQKLDYQLGKSVALQRGYLRIG